MTADVSDASKATLDLLTHWSRQQRESFTRDVEFQYDEYKECRLLEPTYTKAEVEDALHGLFLITQASINQESKKVAEGFRAYVRSILREAERQHAVINVGTNVLDWASSCQQVMETSDPDAHAHTQLLDTQRMSFKKLAPLATDGPIGTTANTVDGNSSHDEIIRKLQEKIQRITEMYAAAKQEQGLLVQENARLREAACAMKTGDDSSAVHIQKLTKEINDLKREISTRLSNSTQFTNLKKMMLDKNATIRSLRERLSRHEKLEEDSDDEIVRE